CLSVDFSRESLELKNFDRNTGNGASLELSGVRFIGVGYLGAGAKRKLETLAKATPPASTPTVLILRGPPGWFETGPDAIDAGTQALLRERFPLILLGHSGPSKVLSAPNGKPWVVVPGAPENVRLDDALWPGPRG